MIPARAKSRVLFLALVPALSVACVRSQKVIPAPRPEPVPSMFTPTAMRLHPTFTRVKNWEGGDPDKPNGIEAELEFTDQFGDTVKAEGTVTFEIYEYRTGAADVRGKPVSTPFVGSLMTPEEQRARWNNPTRTYSFRLADPALQPHHTYVVTATFDPKAGGRSYARIILQPPTEETAKPK